jgi:hypothetical protein
MANTYLNKTTGTSPTSRQKFTFSAWFKLSGTSGNRSIFCIEIDGNTTLNLVVQGTQKIQFVDYNNSAEQAKLQTNRLLRDTNAWYHVVLAADSTQATNTDRLKMYINGVQETSFLSTVYPSQNYNFTNNVGNTRIGISSGPTNYFDGSMSFGEYDANGVWKIKTSPSVTYGTNGFFILKNGNSVTDQSPNTNNFTVGGGNLTNTEDNPSNVFCTLNGLTGVGGDAGNKQVLSQGNLTVTGNQASWCHSRGTLGYSTGKWYWEAKVTGTISDMNIGVSNTGTNLTFGTAQSQAGNTTIYTDGSKNINGTITAGVFTAYSLGDIIGIAHNADANTVTFYKNGSAILSDQPVSGGSDTNWTPASAVYNTTGFFSFNFGNGYFGTTAVASAGTNASGNGIFEYDVPTGYTALSTKGLNL